MIDRPPVGLDIDLSWGKSGSNANQTVVIGDKHQDRMPTTSTLQWVLCLGQDKQHQVFIFLHKSLATKNYRKC